MHRLSSFVVAAGVTLGLASTLPAQTRGDVGPTDEIPLTDYLGLIRQISPAAHDAARAYLQAFEQRCGHALTAAQLRRAVAEGDGDPVLMGMIRAAQLGDGASTRQLVQRIDCASRGAP